MDLLNAEQVLALAPDAAVAEAGRNLSNPARWLFLGRGANSLWGETQGGLLATEPCRTHIGLDGSSPSCSCRSRKMPCKHALGLLLLFAGNPARVPEMAAPGWTQARQAKRGRTTRGHGAPGATPGGTATDPAVLEELQIWLSGLIAEGLGHARQQPAHFFESMAVRLAATRAPGLARRLRTWPALFSAGDPDWADRVLEEIGHLQLLLNSAERLDELPAGPRASVRSALGWPLDEKSLPAAEGEGVETITDTWLSVGWRSGENGGARPQRTWLLGLRTGRTAICVFPEDDRPAGEADFLPGTNFEAALYFYSGSMSLRARVPAQRRGGKGAAASRIEPASLPPAMSGFAEALEHGAAILAADPWMEPIPWFVENCVPDVRHTGGSGSGAVAHWTLRDAADAVVPLPANFPGAWQLLAASGGTPVTVFGEWDGHVLFPLSAIAEGRFIDLAAAVAMAGSAVGGSSP